MNIVNEFNRWERIRTRCVAKFLDANSPQIVLAFSERSFSRYKSGRGRLKEKTLLDAIKYAQRFSKDPRVRQIGQDAIRLFKSGPYGGELWAALDGRLHIKLAARIWNCASDREYQKDGLDLGVKDLDVALPTGVREVAQFERYFGEAQSMFMLAKAVLELRSLAVAMAGSKGLPLETRNPDPDRFLPGHVNRPKAPLFIEPTPSTETAKHFLFEYGFPAPVRQAIDSASELLFEFSISEKELENAIKDVVRAEIAKTRMTTRDR